MSISAFLLGVKNKSPTVIFSPNMVQNKAKATPKNQVPTHTGNQTDINDGGKIKVKSQETKVSIRFHFTHYPSIVCM